MAETIRDVVIRVSLEQVDSKLKLPNFAPAQRQAQAFGRTVVQNNQRISASFKMLNIEVNHLNRNQRQTKRETTETAKKIADDYIRAAEGFHKAASGALALAKGLAKISGASEEELQRAFEPIETVLNTFKGATDLISGMAQGYRALQAATAAGAVANTGLAASNTAIATTGGMAAASMAALNAAVAPLAAVALGVGAAFATIQLLSARYAAQLRRVVPSQEDMARALAKTRRETASLAKESSLLAEKADVVGGRRGAGIRRSQLQDLAAERARAKFLLAGARASEESGAGVVERNKRAKQQQFNVRTFGIEFGRSLVHNDAEIERGEKQQLNAAKQRIALTKRLEEIAKQEQTLKRAQIESDNKSLQVTKEKLQQQKQVLATAKQQLAVEQSKIKSLNTELGLLSKRDLSEVRRIAKRHATGKSITRAEEDFLRSSGVGRQLADRLAAQRGEQRLADLSPQLQHLLQPERAAAQTRASEARATIESSPSEKELVGAIAKAERETAANMNKLTQLQEETITMLQSVSLRIQQAERNLDDVKDRIGSE